MKRLMVFVIVLLLFCVTNAQVLKYEKDKVAKIVKTKTYTAKTYFDSIIIDKATFWMGYEVLDIDFDWGIKYFDKNDSIIYKEGRDNNDKVLYSILYKRNIDGKLIEKEEYNSTGNLKYKTKYIYDLENRINRENIYSENGLGEYYEYFYDLNFKDRISKSIHNLLGSNNSKSEFSFKYYADGLISEKIKKYFENGKLINTDTTIYLSYTKSIPTKIITQGFTAGMEIIDNYNNTKKETAPTYFKIAHNFELDDKMNITKYYEENKNTKSSILYNSLVNSGVYNVKYFYNERNDWIKLILTHGESSYITIREITYLD